MLFRKPKIGFVRMKKVSIYDQLQLEEALFRVDKNRNWFLFNEESEPVTVVMGISGKPDQLLQLDAVKMYFE
jgi:lipoate-protein ligase A